MIGCKRSVVFTLIVLSVFILIPGISSAWEEVENVRMEQVDNDVYIYYDLSGDSEKYNVTVRGSSDGGRNYRLSMKTVSGDVGKEVRPGSGKEIIWKALKDAGELEGDEFVFEVEAVSGLEDELGISVLRLTSEIARRFNIRKAKGIIVVAVKSDSKAFEAGLVAGDIIKEINRVGINTADEYHGQIEKIKKGESIAMLIKRENMGFMVVKLIK